MKMQVKTIKNEMQKNRKETKTKQIIKSFFTNEMHIENNTLDT